MANKKPKLDDGYLRYILKSKNVNIEDLALKLECSQQWLNQKIKNSKLLVSDIFIIMDSIGMKFEDIFKKKN